MGSLDEYRSKRDPEKTPEPMSNSGKATPSNRYVIQKHDASRLHYDFRIQVADVLISWAVPKGPPESADEQRLAVQTEDHPLDYFHFEGTIPKGQYGGGTVMVWDVGFYFLHDSDGAAKPSEVYAALKKGKLSLRLRGNRLDGDYTLVKSKKEDQWLFLKKKDQNPDEDRSILTERTLSEIAGEKTKTEDTASTSSSRRKAKARKEDFPGFMPPMLATLTGDIFEGEEWIFEDKYDGYRILALKEDEHVKLLSRNENSYNESYGELAKSLERIPAKFVMDGEVCALDSKGRPDFQKLQNKDNSADLVYFAFDLIWLNGHDLSEVPLLRRKELLKALLQKADERIRYVDHVKGEGRSALEKARKSGMEGVMAKRAKSTYEVGSRSKNWLKIKFSESQEVVICGYLASGPNLRSLLCCVNRGGDLIYSGKVGIGFSEAQGKAIVKVLKKHARKTPPEVKNLPDDDNVHWVTPNEVCEVRFTEWTAAGSMRHPVFLGLRSDKTASDIVREVKIAPPPVDLPFTLSNPDKLFWKEEGITKKDVFDYYNTVADCILPYLRNRPMSLYRTPDGADDDGFFQKDVSETAPDWLETTLVKSSDRNIEYALCQDRKALLYLVNLGCIEMNPWNATVDGPEHPDLLVFDLDPLDISYSEVIRVALKLKKVLVDLEIPSFPKTTGSKGFHVFVPIVPNLTHKQVQNFAKKIMGHLHRLLPQVTSLERSPQKRKGKVYLDYLQNGRGKTMASVYSLRPRAWSAVSVPLKWGEVVEDLDPKKFTIRATLARLEAVGDVWKDMSLAPIDLKKRFDQ